MVKHVRLRIKICLEGLIVTSLLMAVISLASKFFSPTNSDYRLIYVIVVLLSLCVYVARIIVRDVNLYIFEDSQGNPAVNIIEIKQIDKIILYLFSFLSLFVAILCLIIYGITTTKGVASLSFSIIFIAIVSIPLIFTIKIIVTDKLNEERSIVVKFGLIILICAGIGSASISIMSPIFLNIHEFSAAKMEQMKQEVYITSINGVGNDDYINNLDIAISAGGSGFDVSKFVVNLRDGSNTSRFVYGRTAESNHFTYLSGNSIGTGLSIGGFGDINVDTISSGIDIRPGDKVSIEIIVNDEQTIHAELIVPSVIHGNTVIPISSSVTSSLKSRIKSG